MSLIGRGFGEEIEVGHGRVHSRGGWPITDSCVLSVVGVKDLCHLVDAVLGNLRPLSEAPAITELLHAQAV